MVVKIQKVCHVVKFMSQVPGTIRSELEIPLICEESRYVASNLPTSVITAWLPESWTENIALSHTHHRFRDDLLFARQTALRSR